MPEVGTVAAEQTFFPLELVRCDRCTLVQIGLEVDPEILFPPEYPYRSASTKILRENFVNLYAQVTSTISLEDKDLVVDIGSNDGTLLQNFAAGGHRVLGIEPSEAAKDAEQAGIPSWMKFFSKAVGRQVVEELGSAKVVTAANVFAHIPDPGGIVDGVVDMLAPEGIFVSESHYFPALVETLQYDTIYHEHLRYYSLGSIRFLLEAHGLEVFKVQKIATHGGSMRVFAARPGERPIDASVGNMLADEGQAGITEGSGLESFRDKVIQSKLDLHSLIAPLKAAGARIYGIGAPSRATTLINYTGLDEGIMECVLEISSSAKLNKYIPGTRIPVLDEKMLFEDQPEYALLLSWHITDELITNLSRKGFIGRYIIPLPKPRILEA